MTAATLAVAGWKEAADERIRRGSAARSQATMADDSAGSRLPMRLSSSLVSRCSK